jgi:hypothetical protein
LLKVLLRENQALVPKRFVDPHRYGVLRLVIAEEVIVFISFLIRTRIDRKR